ncbi:MAG: hypothetical protein H6658_19215 [Ardenticatenaceae bacterium]|nr:hypothetical protein [Ardenticatenaceae bacterium]
MILDPGAQAVASRLRSQGRNTGVLLRAIEELAADFPLAQIAGVGLSGSGGGPVARRLAALSQR